MSATVAASPLQSHSVHHVTASLDAFGLDYWPPHASRVRDALGEARAAGNPDREEAERDGTRAASYRDVFYDTLHVIPQRLDLGNLVTAQVRTVEVWNAYFEARTLADIDAAGAAGLELGAPDTPAGFPPLHSEAWELSIGAAGPAAIDATYTLHWDGDRVSALRVTGARVVAWAHTHNWRRPLIERYQWLTAIDRAWDGSESRRALRTWPRRGIDQLTTVTGEAAAAADAALWIWGARVYAVPHWGDGTRLLAPAAAGAQSLTVADTTDREFQVGSLVMLRRGHASHEIGEVAGVAAASIDLGRPLEQSWPAGTAVYPTGLGRLPPQHDQQRHTATVGEIALRWELADRRRIEPPAPAITYRDQELLERAPSRSTPIPLAYARTLDRHDNRTGRVERDDRPGRPRVGQQIRYLLRTRADLSWLLAFAYRRAGRRHEYWQPSWQSDLRLAAAVGASATEITVHATGFARSYGVTVGRRDIRIQLRDAGPLYRRITAAEDNGDGTETLGIDTALGVQLQPADAVLISFLTLSRLAADTIEIQRHSAGIAETSFNTVSLDHDD